MCSSRSAQHPVPLKLLQHLASCLHPPHRCLSLLLCWHRDRVHSPIPVINEAILAAHLLLVTAAAPTFWWKCGKQYRQPMWEPMCSVLPFSGFSVWIRVCVSKWAFLECYIWSKPVWNELSCLSDSGLLLQRFSIWVRCLFSHRGRPLLIEVAHTCFFFLVCHSLPALFPPWNVFCFYTRVCKYYFFIFFYKKHCFQTGFLLYLPPVFHWSHQQVVPL